MGFDGSPESHLALGYAPARAGTMLRMLTVLEPLPAVLERLVPLPGLDGPRADRACGGRPPPRRRRAAAVDAAIAQLGNGVRVETSLLGGDHTARVLLDGTGGVDLLVVGSRGYGPRRRTLLGGVPVAAAPRRPPRRHRAGS